MATLQLSNISKSYGATPALSGVSLDVASGEFICLLGASGCGKTTLLRIIAGLEQHDKGEIQLDGSDLSAVPCHQRNIGMVFQSLALFPHLNVSENITYGQRMRGVSQEDRQQQSEHLLGMVGLAGFGQRRVKQLSGGQRQRVAIARALALEPQLFLMDEPFSALDAGLRDHLQLEVRKLQQDLGVTTVFVTHDQREAMALADRIVILNQGEIEQAATPAEIYRYPQTRFVAEFIGNNNLLDIEVSADAVRFGDIDLGVPQGAMAKLRGDQTLAIRPEAIRIEQLGEERGSEILSVKHPHPNPSPSEDVVKDKPIPNPSLSNVFNKTLDIKEGSLTELRTDVSDERLVSSLDKGRSGGVAFKLLQQPPFAIGRITLQRQVGALIEREIDVAGAIIRQTEFQNTAAALKNGDEVVLSWDWSQVWVLPQ